ncbi:hypothetical protein Mgra_00007257 [Meloidogyne graminicola]|uniref:BPTI/Kunitz inhibitor domain-containing protein n=1 Tax=Meloidogyne graminicola TaxID=189291 RepID=A0A8S9ZJ53_9BILA|nr:hypothetical protein Mgra_00007257 [Meloidogyne graminicola]
MNLSKTKKCFTLLSLFTLFVFIIYWNKSSNLYNICGTIFPLQDDFQKRRIVIYNRIPKTASTSFANAIGYDLCKQNGFHVAHINLTKSRMQMGKIDQFLLAKNITEWTDIQPIFLHGHFAFVDFQSFGFPSPIWINILREPFDRLVSYFYFLRHGDNFRVGLKRSKAGNNETFDECFLNGNKECNPTSVWLQIPYFCGAAHFCSEPGNQQALNKAKYNLLNNYLIVGTTDRIEQMIQILEFLIPEYFRNAYKHFLSLDVPSIRPPQQPYTSQPLSSSSTSSSPPPSPTSLTTTTTTTTQQPSIIIPFNQLFNNTLQPIQSANIHGALIRLIFHTTTLQTIINNSISTTSSTISELPTPPPYTQNIPGDYSSSLRPNPCPQGQPLINGLNNPMTCNFVVKPNGGCPKNFWCHTGASYETTTCCPYNDYPKSRCQLSRAGGKGDELIPRWYFDNNAHKCKRFLYRGMHGNANNFVTAMSCSETCENSEYLSSVIRNPCSNGWPARDLSGKQFICGTADSRCPAGYFCHLGELSSSNVCCELSTSVSNRCNLALRIGEGIANLKRFYFNTLTRKCTEFVYKGIKGNENSFLTIDECKSTCEKLPNPCPMHFDLGERKECSGVDGQSCGRGEWCHIGSRIETTACCPAAIVDICKLPLDLGHGIENLTRWYAVNSEDPCARECRPFQYRGMKGNQNNFQTKSECEINCKSECPINPCPENEELLINKEGKPYNCNSTKIGQCPPNYWCHIGANIETSVCCSIGAGKACNQSVVEGYGNALLSRWYYNYKEGNCQKFIYRGIKGNRNNYVDYDDYGEPCIQPLSEGEGNSQLERFYFDSIKRRCRSFIYKGAFGNANNFLLEEDCEYICSTFIHPNPCSHGYPLIIDEFNNNNNNKPLICGNNELIDFLLSDDDSLISSGCPNGYWCHVGSSPETTNCCPNIPNISGNNNNICDLTLELGNGTERLNRWYFDSSIRRCRKFWYSGIDRCLLSLNRGVDIDNSWITRWHFNVATGKCEVFNYAGIKGNENNFITKKECEHYCLDKKVFNYCPHGEPKWENNGKTLEPKKCGLKSTTDCGDGFICHLNIEKKMEICCEDPAYFCLKPRDPGHCSDNQIRYGYNPMTDNCVSYRYSGCGGTLNQFETLEQCKEICCKQYAENSKQKRRKYKTGLIIYKQKKIEYLLSDNNNNYRFSPVYNILKADSEMGIMVERIVSSKRIINNLLIIEWPS